MGSYVHIQEVKNFVRMEEVKNPDILMEVTMKYALAG